MVNPEARQLFCEVVNRLGAWSRKTKEDILAELLGLPMRPTSATIQIVIPTLEGLREDHAALVAEPSKPAIRLVYDNVIAALRALMRQPSRSGGCPP